MLHPTTPDPLTLGWRKESDRLLPVLSMERPAPDAVLHLVRCNCGSSSSRVQSSSKTCSRRCSCRALASHFTPEVIEASVANGIVFACLIPNSTHLLQPLDVAVFRPVKTAWKRILETWRKDSRTRGSIPKGHFPGLLSRLYSHLKPENLVAGFKASGIFQSLSPKHPPTPPLILTRTDSMLC